MPNTATAAEPSAPGDAIEVTAITLSGERIPLRMRPTAAGDLLDQIAIALAARFAA